MDKLTTMNTKEAIIERFKALLTEEDFKVVKSEVGDLRAYYRNISREQRKELFKAFVEDGGVADDFEAPADPLDEEFKALLDAYGERKAVVDEEKRLAAERRAAEIKAKVTQKKDIVEKLKALNEAIDPNKLGEAFDAIKPLQEAWKGIGRTGGEASKQTQIDYNHQVDVFFHKVNMIKEFRTLDLQRNLQEKNTLIAKVEGILTREKEPNVRDMETLVKQYQNDWKQIGPVPREQNEEVYQRYRSACDAIYDKVNAYYDARRADLQANLKSKITLCEQLQAINAFGYDQHHEWQEKTEEVLKAQQAWKAIGFSEENETVWKVFRNSCNTFFDKKRAFYAGLDRKRELNKQQKLALVDKAEAMRHSTDWRDTTNALIKLQQEWRKVGAASRKDENKLWDRFRTACDTFFDAKRDFFNNVEAREANNLTLKEALIERIGTTTLTGDNAADLETLKQFAKDWSEIGFVPIAEKNRIINAYNAALEDKYGQLTLSDSSDKPLLIFKNKMEVLMQADNGDVLIKREREVIIEKISRLQDEIHQYENNIGFFSNSRGAAGLLADVKKKLNTTKARVSDFRKKLQVIKKLRASSTAQA